MWQTHTLWRIFDCKTEFNNEKRKWPWWFEGVASDGDGDGKGDEREIVGGWLRTYMINNISISDSVT